MTRYFPILILVFLPFVIHAPIWMGFVDFYSGDASDLIPYIYGMKLFLYQTFHELGEIPLWNPYLLFGQPVVGNIQYSLFYPLNILFFLFSFFQALWIYQVVHMIIAGLGTYLLAKHIGIGKYGSTLSGCLYMLNGRILYYINAGWLGYFSSICWLPLLLLMSLQVLKRKELYFPILLGLVLAMTLLAGTPQYALFGCYLFFIHGILQLFLYKTKKERQALLLRIFLTGLLFFLLISIQLFPAIEQTYLSSRIFFNDQLYGYHFEWDLRQWFRILFRPELLRQDFAWELCAYIGIGGMVLSLKGLVSFRKSLTLVFIWGIIPWLVSMGPAVSPIAFIMKNVPGMSLLTNPSRYFIFTIFVLCLAAGRGFDNIIDQFNSANGKMRFLLISACLLLLSGLLITPYNQSYSIVNIRYFFSAVLFIFMAILYIRLRNKVLKIALLCCLIVDPIILSADILNGENHIKDLQAPEKIIQALKDYNHPTRVATIQPENLRDSLLNPFDDWISFKYKISRAAGDEPLSMLSSLQFLAKMDGTDVISDVMWGFRLWGFSRPDLYNIAGITHLITFTPVKDPNLKFIIKDNITMPHFHGGWWTNKPVYLYQNIKAFPRAFFLPFRSNGPVSPIDITYDTPSHLRIQFHAKQSGTAVISESFHPGWFAKGSEMSIQLKPFLKTFLSFDVYEGKHDITLDFSPKSFRLGLLFTMIGLLLILSVIVYQYIYRKE